MIVDIEGVHPVQVKYIWIVSPAAPLVLLALNHAGKGPSCQLKLPPPEFVMLTVPISCGQDVVT
jgi:hypothetical protein